jgi:hypothetical protein
MKTLPSTRILAVEIRAGRLGYAVFETSKQLLDLGAAWFESSEAARLRILGLLRLSGPSVLVLRSVSPRRPRKNALWQSVARIAGSEARKLSIPVARVSERAFEAYFDRHSCRNKYDVAAILAVWFPEIAWRLPPRRRFYEPEARAMLYFDAVALGTVYMWPEGLKSHTEARDDWVFSPAPRWRS